MATIKQRLHLKTTNGYVIMHLETSSDLVMRADGSTVETALVNLTNVVSTKAATNHTHTDIINSINTHVTNKSNPHSVTAAQIGAAVSNHTHTAAQVGALPTAGGTMTGIIYSSRTTNTHIAGNQGTAIINSTAGAGTYTMLVKMNSSGGYFTHGVYQSRYELHYTAKNVVDAGTNNVTYTCTLLDEAGNASFPVKVTAPTFSGALNGNATSATKLANTRTIQVNLGSTAAASFDGTANIAPGVTGTLPVARGGTGVTSIAALKTALGIVSGGNTIAGIYTYKYHGTGTYGQSNPTVIPYPKKPFILIIAASQASEKSAWILTPTTNQVDFLLNDGHAYCQLTWSDSSLSMFTTYTKNAAAYYQFNHGNNDYYVLAFCM